jgi:AcrR family transcriptional regulator
MPEERAAPKLGGAYHHGDLRQALLDAALAEVERNGPEAVSLAALARALGVSQAAPYRHFTDRDALLAAVAMEGFRAFVETLRASLAAASSQPALSRICQAYVAFGLARPGLYRLMFDSQILSRPTPGDELLGLSLESFRLLVETLPAQGEEMRRRRALRIWAGLHGVVMLAARDLLGGPMPLPLEDLVEDIAATGSA